MKSDSLAVKQRYDRIAPYFDGLQAIMEGFFTDAGVRSYGLRLRVLIF